MRRSIAAAALGIILGACGGSDGPQLTDLIIPNPAEQLEASGESFGSLESFFEDDTEPAAPILSDSTEGAGGSAESAAEPDPVSEPDQDPEPTATVPAETPTENVPVGTAADELGPDAAISAEPASVLLAATHSVTVTGSDLPPGAEMIVAGCQLGGDPIGTSMTAATLVERASAIDASEACDLAGSERVTVGDDGSFTTELDIEVGPATAIFAGGVDANYAVFSPIYLES